MKHLLLIITILLMAVPAQAASPDVNVSVSMGQPGFYGQIDIGNAPRPALIYPKPVVVHPAPVHVVQEPLYLHVPPGHQKKWSKHCSKYNACNRQVYFVKDKWYNDVYVPHYRAQHGGNGGDKHHGGKKDKHKKDKHDKHDGNENGNGHGKGKH